MHSNIWWTVYLLLAPAVVIFMVAVIMRSKAKPARHFFFAGAALLIIPIIFLIAHFASLNSEMAKRAGTYILANQKTIHGRCSDTKFDSLKLTLHKNGKFAFNYWPCFADKITGSWEWTDNMVHSYSRFEKLNDSLELDIPSESEADTIIILTAYNKRYLTFVKFK